MPKLCLLLLCLLLLSCENADFTSKDLSKNLAELKQGLQEVTANKEQLASEEIEKLFVYEYKIVSLPFEVHRQEEELSRLGMQRWECFHIDVRENEVRAYCKRRPKTYLRYIPRVF